jgi:hypothetical protein
MRIGLFWHGTPSAIVLISCRFFLAVRFAARVRMKKILSFAQFLHSVEVYPPPVDYPKSFSLLDLEFVGKRRRVYAKIERTIVAAS